MQCGLRRTVVVVGVEFFETLTAELPFDGFSFAAAITRRGDPMKLASREVIGFANVGCFFSVEMIPGHGTHSSPAGGKLPAVRVQKEASSESVLGSAVEYFCRFAANVGEFKDGDNVTASFDLTSDFEATCFVWVPVDGFGSCAAR